MPARFLVQETYSPLKRKESNKTRIPLIVYLPFIAGYLVYGSQPHNMPVVGAYFPTPTPTQTTDNFLLLPPDVSSTSTVAPRPTSAFLLPASPTPRVLSEHQVIIERFPYILDKDEWHKSGQRVKFSYYYPPLGGVNCHEDNWVNGQCKDTTASRQSWKEYMNKGIAVHPDMLSLLPYGSIVYVVSPASIAGYYTVIDLCGGCLINGNYYFDFLFPEMPEGLNWSVDVDFLPVRFSWDGGDPTPSPVYPTITPSPTFPPDITSTPYIVVVTATSQPATSTPYPTYTPYPTFTPLPLPSETPLPTESPLSTETPSP